MKHSLPKKNVRTMSQVTTFPVRSKYYVVHKTSKHYVLIFPAHIPVLHFALLSGVYLDSCSIKGKHYTFYVTWHNHKTMNMHGKMAISCTPKVMHIISTTAQCFFFLPCSWTVDRFTVLLWRFNEENLNWGKSFQSFR